MNTRRTAVIFLCLFVPAALPAQGMKDAAPLKYWSAPLYWQPSAAERSSFAKIATASRTSSASTPLMFVAMTPCRVIDTRAIFNFPAPFGAPSLVGGATRSFPMQASTLCSLPSTAAAYSLNVTVTPVGGGLGFLTIWPAGSAQPNSSTLNNPNALAALANAVIIPAGNDASGSLDAYASSATDLIVDINGYYTAQTTSVTGIILGSSNTAVGFGGDLASDTTGAANTAVGSYALAANTTGLANAAFGDVALETNTSGQGNTAVGSAALAANTTGNGNTAIGADALQLVTTGSSNIAIGANAGSNLSSNAVGNIIVASTGFPSDNHTIRIGTLSGQSSFFAGGISGATTGLSGAVPVVIDSNGQLGTISSSARFKEDIHDMDDASSGLLSLRPVTFRYRQAYADGTKPLDYGLIAEEVAKIYPDLVVKGADGQIQTVQYQKLTPMLLNELQKQQQEIQQLRKSLSAIKDLLSSE